MAVPDPMEGHWRALRLLFAGTAFDGASVRVDLPPGWVPWERPRPRQDRAVKDLDEVVADLAAPRHGNSPGLDRDHLAGLGIACPFYAIRLRVAQAVYVAEREVDGASRAHAESPDVKALDDIIAKADLAMAALSPLLAQDLAAILTLPPPAADARSDYAAENARRAAVRDHRDALTAAVPALSAMAALARKNRAAMVGAGQSGRVWERSFARTLMAVWYEWTGKWPDVNKGRWHELLDAAVSAIGRERPVSWASVSRSAKTDLVNRPAWYRPGTRTEDPPGTSPAITATEARVARDRAEDAFRKSLMRDLATLARQGQPGADDGESDPTPN